MSIPTRARRLSLISTLTLLGAGSAYAQQNSGAALSAPASGEIGFNQPPQTMGGGGASGGAMRPRGGGGMVMSFVRGKTALDALRIDWKAPATVEVPRAEEGRTVATMKTEALSLAEAVERLRGDDPRPLLVMRECDTCTGNEHQSLGRTLGKEETRALTRWFHCVRLQENVLEDDHTFAKLFDLQQPPHIVLATTAGALYAVRGDETQSQMWKLMYYVLSCSYEGDVDDAIREIFRAYSELDHLDATEDQLSDQLDVEIETSGPRSARVKRLRAKLEKVRKERERAIERERRASDLPLREVEPPSKPAGR